MNLFLKRCMDIVASLAGILLLSPLFLILAAAVRRDSKGPVFFCQDRRTKDGKIFKMYKFRSMVVGAEKQGAGLFNYEGDARVTRVGRFMRDHSLDELPQLINVLQGSMSLVGPRPCVSYELGDYDTLNGTYKKRFRMKAGITGLAQVRGRNDISWEEKVKWDNQYIDMFQKYGVLLDIRLLFETLVKAGDSQGIYEGKKDGSLCDAEAARRAEAEIIKKAHLPDDTQGR